MVHTLFLRWPLLTLLSFFDTSYRLIQRLLHSLKSLEHLLLFFDDLLLFFDVLNDLLHLCMCRGSLMFKYCQADVICGLALLRQPGLILHGSHTDPVRPSCRKYTTVSDWRARGGLAVESCALSFTKERKGVTASAA